MLGTEFSFCRLLRRDDLLLRLNLDWRDCAHFVQRGNFCIESLDHFGRQPFECARVTLLNLRLCHFHNNRFHQADRLFDEPAAIHLDLYLHVAQVVSGLSHLVENFRVHSIAQSKTTAFRSHQTEELLVAYEVKEVGAFVLSHCWLEGCGVGARIFKIYDTGLTERHVFRLDSRVPIHPERRPGLFRLKL